MSADPSWQAAWLPEFVDLLERRTGLVAEPSRVVRSLCEHPMLRDYVRHAGGPGEFAARLACLSTDHTEWTTVIKELTVSETWFFRDQEQFDSIATVVRQLAISAPYRPVCIWSAACATGDEAWSLAILCEELGIAAEVLGTDINSSCVHEARKGSYRQRQLRHMDEDWCGRWFQQDGEFFRLRDAARLRIRFAVHNLARDAVPVAGSPDGTWDLVVCRNVFLYFSRSGIRAICARIAQHIRPDGAFVTGAAESLHGLDVPFVAEPVGQRVVHRVVGPHLLPAANRGLSSRTICADRVAMASLAHDPAPASDASPPEQAAHAHPLNLEDPLERVASLAAAGDLRKADELLQTLLEDRPSTKAHLTLGHLRLREHALDDAIEAFGQVAERDSLLAEAHYFQALAYRKAGRWEDAERGFRRALFLAPGLWQAGFLLGGTYQRLGRLRESQRELAWVRRLVAGELPVFNFQSHPVFLTWFELDVAKVRTLLEAGDSDTPLD